MITEKELIQEVQSRQLTICGFIETKWLEFELESRKAQQQLKERKNNYKNLEQLK